MADVLDIFKEIHRRHEGAGDDFCKAFEAQRSEFRDLLAIMRARRDDFRDIYASLDKDPSGISATCKISKAAVPPATHGDTRQNRGNA
jgi:hypothetical protein